MSRSPHPMRLCHVVELWAREEPIFDNLTTPDQSNCPWDRLSIPRKTMSGDIEAEASTFWIPNRLHASDELRVGQLQRLPETGAVERGAKHRRQSLCAEQIDVLADEAAIGVGP